MGSKIPNWLKLILVVALLIGAGWGVQRLRSAAAAPAALEAEAAIARPAAGAEKPLDGWLNKYDQQRALVERIQRLQKEAGIADLIQQANQAAQDLTVATPADMQFNPQSRYFEWKPGKGPAATSAPAAPPAIPAKAN